MRIQHNITALNAYRNLTNNNSAVAKNLEKLSSGYRINRAGDDAAGLAISEKMRAQITGLKTAQKNANDGISLVQTAEGALTEVHSMLNRMVELATQSANGTYDDDVDRANLQKEVNSLLDEINRISDGTNFNGINLLDGTYGSAASKVEMSAANKIDLTSQDQGVGANDPLEANNGKTVLHEAGKAEQKAQFTLDLDTVSVTGSTAASQVNFTIGTGTAANTVNVSVKAGQNMTSKELAQALKDQIDTLTATAKDGSTIQGGIRVGDVVYKAEVDGNKVVFTQADGQKLSNSDDLTPDGEMKLEMNAANGAVVNGHYSSGALNIQSGVAQSSIVLAHAEFELTTDMVKDGAQLTIGDETYTFRVGKDSFVDEGGKNVIDLSDFEKDQDGLMKEAAARLSQAAFAGNAMFNVGVLTDVPEANANVTLSIDEKASYSGKADLTTKEGIEAQLSFKTVVNEPRGDAKSLTLQIGDTSDDYNKLKLHIDATDTKTLGIADINIGTQDGAAAAVDKIKAAINKVSSVRGDMGAIQNRLEHTINNLSVQTENITAAESRIRDVDMAEEMMAYTKNNILVQASQAMLAQANQVPQGVLQLLQ